MANDGNAEANLEDDGFVNPFVGAVPYAEKDHMNFFGRTQEINYLIDNMVNDRLNVLAGESAAGKTSLVCAGLIPELGKRRIKRLEEMGAGGRDVFPYPVFVFREWGGVSTLAGRSVRESLDIYLWELLQSAVENQLDPKTSTETADFKIQDDFNAASKILAEAHQALKDDDIKDHEVFGACINEFIAEFGGVYLIFDQLEELFRSRTQETNEIIGVIRDLYHLGRRVRILLSLREEYLHPLRFLDGEVGSIMSRAYFLRAIKTDDSDGGETIAINEIVNKAFQGGGFELSEDVRKALIYNCTGATDNDEQSKIRRNNLLTLQVVSQEVFEFLRGAAKPRGKVGPEHMEAFENSIIEKYLQMEGEDKRKLVYANALQRWITKSLERDGQDETLQSGHIRWIATRLAAYLSQGDFKVVVSQEQLWEKFISALGYIELMNDPGEDEKILGAEKIVHELFRKTLDKLEKANIVKFYGGKDDKSGASSQVELVHDLMGPAFSDWSDAQRDSLLDGLASPIKNIGVDVMLRPGKQVVPDIYKAEPKFFRGCSYVNYVNEAKLKTWEGMAVFTGEHFKKWTFKGTFFKGVKFKNCMFDGTDLQGALFSDCDFDGVWFVNLSVDKSQLDFRGCRFKKVTFNKCKVRQLTITNNDDTKRPCELVRGGEDGDTSAIQLIGNTVFQLSRIDSVKGDGEALIKADAGSRFEYCMWDKDSAEKIKANAAQFISCGPSAGIGGDDGK